MTNLVKQHTPGADRLRSSYDDGCQGGIVARLDVTECPLWVMSGHSDSFNVRFTPNSGHSGRRSACLLCANSGHRVIYLITSAR